jgi:hypothetical protein
MAHSPNWLLTSSPAARSLRVRSFSGRRDSTTKTTSHATTDMAGWTHTRSQDQTGNEFSPLISTKGRGCAATAESWPPTVRHCVLVSYAPSPSTLRLGNSAPGFSQTSLLRTCTEHNTRQRLERTSSTTAPGTSGDRTTSKAGLTPYRA